MVTENFEFYITGTTGSMSRKFPRRPDGTTTGSKPVLPIAAVLPLRLRRYYRFLAWYYRLCPSNPDFLLSHRLILFGLCIGFTLVFPSLICGF